LELQAAEIIEVRQVKGSAAANKMAARNEAQQISGSVLHHLLSN